MADELIGSAPGGDTGAETASPAPVDVVSTPASESSPGARVDAASGGDLDDEDEDVYDEERLVQDRAALRNLIRNRRRDGKFAKENRTLVRRIKDANLDLDDLIVTQRNHQSLMARLEAEPELLQRIVTPSGRPAERPQAQQPQQRPQYQPLQLPPPPFDAGDEGGKYVHELHSALNALHKELWETRQGVGMSLRDVLQWRKGLDTERTEATGKQITQAWNETYQTIAKDYDEDGADLVRSEISHFLDWAKKENRQDILRNPRPFVDKVLAKVKGLSRFKKAQQAAAAALSQQASAAAAVRAPRPSAFTGGTPAPARSRHRETVKDVSRRLLRGA